MKNELAIKHVSLMMLFLYKGAIIRDSKFFLTLLL